MWKLFPPPGRIDWVSDTAQAGFPKLLSSEICSTIKMMVKMKHNTRDRWSNTEFQEPKVLGSRMGGCVEKEDRNLANVQKVSWSLVSRASRCAMKSPWVGLHITTRIRAFLSLSFYCSLCFGGMYVLFPLSTLPSSVPPWLLIWDFYS